VVSKDINNFRGKMHQEHSYCFKPFEVVINKQIQILIPNFTTKDLVKAIQALLCGKALGLDKFPI
jgi:hypothetical protein